MHAQKKERKKGRHIYRDRERKGKKERKADRQRERERKGKKEYTVKKRALTAPCDAKDVI